MNLSSNIQTIYMRKNWNFRMEAVFLGYENFKKFGGVPRCSSASYLFFYSVKEESGAGLSPYYLPHLFSVPVDSSVTFKAGYKF